MSIIKYTFLSVLVICLSVIRNPKSWVCFKGYRVSKYKSPVCPKSSLGPKIY
jgi:hypothetical protein